MKRVIKCLRCGNEHASAVERPKCGVCGLLLVKKRCGGVRVGAGRKVGSTKKSGMLSGMEVGDERVFDWFEDVKRFGGTIKKYDRIMRYMTAQFGWDFEVKTSVYRIRIRRVR